VNFLLKSALPVNIVIFHSLSLNAGYKSLRDVKTHKMDRDMLYICKTNGSVKLLVILQNTVSSKIHK
jgi:hypothetical protein